MWAILKALERKILYQSFGGKSLIYTVYIRFFITMKFTGLALVALCAIASAHPGHDVSQEIKERAEFKALSRRSDLSHCASKLRVRGVNMRNHLRRSEMLKSLNRRTLSSDVATNHNKTLSGITLNTPEGVVFSGNNSCILTPEVTDGPYCKLRTSNFKILWIGWLFKFANAYHSL